jgi:hypothetical protein
MKHLKSSIAELRTLFERSIAIKDIAEPLASFDAEHPAPQIHSFMEEKDYDLIGVRQNGLLTGYARRGELFDGPLGDYLVPFEPAEMVPDTTPLLSGLQIVKEHSRAFVVMVGHIGGIVTRRDLQKAPVRMWLFGVISLIEMQLLRMIRDHSPGESWKINPTRLDKAKKLLIERKQKNIEIDLADCLQFCDKRDIVLANADLRRALGFDSKPQGKALLKDLEELRDVLAHAQDIITGRWPTIVDLASRAEEFLSRCEKIPDEKPSQSDARESAKIP